MCSSPSDFNLFPRLFDAITLASAMSIFAEEGTGSVQDGTEVSASGTSGTVNEKHEPPYLFGSNDIVPFIAVTSVRQIASPSPEPPYFREIDASP